MTIQRIIDDLLHLQDKLAQLPFPHPWDNHVAKNSVARIDALISDLRVVACRMREDQPCNCDQATDQAVPVEPAEWMVSGVPHRTNPQTGKLEPIPVWTLPSPTFSPQAQQAMLAECDDPQPEPQPITEAAMRAAQVGWVVRTECGDEGVIDYVNGRVFEAKIRHGRAQWTVSRCGQHPLSGLGIVSLAPPEVVANVAEVLL